MLFPIFPLTLLKDKKENFRKRNIRTDYYAVMQLMFGYPKEGDKHPIGKPRKNDRVIRIGE